MKRQMHRYYIISTLCISLLLWELKVPVCIAFLSNSIKKADYSHVQSLYVEQGANVLISDSATINPSAVLGSPPVSFGNKNKPRGDSVSYQNHHKQRIRAMFREAKTLERSGQWREASTLLLKILRIDPYDAHSHLAYARIQSRRESTKQNLDLKNESFSLLTETNNTMNLPKIQVSVEFLQTLDTSKARNAFITGTQHCPGSVHLWQAWAMHEETLGNIDYARTLYERALSLEPFNPFVCHAYGLMEQRCGNPTDAERLLRTPLNSSCTAALVCSLGELLTIQKRFHDARVVYFDHVQKVPSERQVSEIYLAAAWLEEKHFQDRGRAEELLHLALKESPNNSRAQVALARFEGRRAQGIKLDMTTDKSISVEKILHGGATITRNHATRSRLEKLCSSVERKHLRESHSQQYTPQSEVNDGRLFNTWANLEMKCGNYTAARDILARGMSIFPQDHSIVQAAGNVEERLGNFSAASQLYSASLAIQPSAPTLVAIAMLELRNPNRINRSNMTRVERLFEEALLLDRRHGPVYNAYGTMELQRGDVDKAREIYIRGLQARCTAAASVYHGLAKLELSQGNIESARATLKQGLKEAENQDSMMDNHQRDRASFLSHTLGMLELRCNRAAEAKQIFLDGIRRFGGTSQLLLGSALCELKLGNEDRARSLFEQAVTVDKKHAQAWQSWAVVEMRAGNYKLAKTLFELGIQNDPTHGALWQAYATLEGRRGNVNAARGLFAAGVLKCPSHVPLYQAWACLELRSENTESAKILISQALTRDKSHGSSWLIAAKIEEKMGNGGLVGLILERALECSPNDPELYRARADLEMKKGQFQKARTMYEKGLEVDPTHAPLYHSLAELEARVLNIEGLAKLNKKAAQIFNTNALMPTQASASVLRRKLRSSSGISPDAFSTLGKELAMGMELDLEEIIIDVDPQKIIQGFSDTDVRNML